MDGRKYPFFKQRRGMVLVAALLLMAIMSIIGATAITTSRIDIKISHNTKVSRQAFYFSDGGVEMSPKVIRKLIDEGQVLPLTNVTMDSPGVFNEIMGFLPGGEFDDDDKWTNGEMKYPYTSSDPTPDIIHARGTETMIIDIDRSGKSFAAGSGAEFAAGSEGAGSGSAGGVFIFYTIDSLAAAANNARSYIDVYYRYVVGVAGGK
ncbi:MAG: pilus assembly PilX N-terminal domain-containing protein [Pseudomonadota bacterium]